MDTKNYAPIDYPVIPEERSDDLHNIDHADRADLVLFMAGNQFMAMPELVKAFRQAHPEAATIAYETLPPGLELKQILAGGARFGDAVINIQPDIYTSVSRGAMQQLADRGMIDPQACFVYLHNKLSLMVKKGNPRGIIGVSDLGREDVVVSQPNPEYEHIAGHITAMYKAAGGRALAEAIMEKKKAGGTTLLTTVHHRETPRRLIHGEADVGPVWHTEIIEAKNAGFDIEGVEVAADLDQRDAINYYIAPLNAAKNPANARKFLEFITTPRAREIFDACGFITEGAWSLQLREPPRSR